MLVGVVSHINRKELADKLASDVEADFVSRDNTWPPNTKGCATNHIRTLTDLKRKSITGEWCVVLEDDAVPVVGFRRELHRALIKSDSSLVGLYVGTGNPDGATQRAIIPAVSAARSSDAAWIESDWFISTVGYAIRSEWLSGLVSALSTMGGPVDNRISEWSQQVGLKTWYCQPSLVDHDDQSSMITSFQFHPRHAHRYGIRDEWNRRTVQMGYAHGWSPEHARP